MKKIILLFSLTIFLTSCADEHSKIATIEYQNYIILSDLSSRIDNKPSKDIEEIHNILERFKNEIVKPGEKIGDKSSISFSTFSSKSITEIDISKIKNLGEKQQFINSTGKYKNEGFKEKLIDFEKIVEDTYLKNKNQGLDLISVLIDKIDNGSIIKHDKKISDGVNSKIIKYDNHIYIFTDGYLEYLNKNVNSQYYFGINEIDKIRQYCQAKKIDVEKALKSDKTLGLPTNKTKVNKLINLHILETQERDKDDKLQTYTYPKGLRDNEILEAVWRKWSTESGFKSFDWKKY